VRTNVAHLVIARVTPTTVRRGRLARRERMESRRE
jgi:hypothetical protein